MGRDFGSKDLDKLALWEYRRAEGHPGNGQLDFIHNILVGFLTHISENFRHIGLQFQEPLLGESQDGLSDEEGSLCGRKAHSYFKPVHRAAGNVGSQAWVVWHWCHFLIYYPGVKKVKSLLGEGHLALDTHKSLHSRAVLGQRELREIQPVSGAENLRPPVVAKNQTGAEPKRPSLLRQDVVEETWLGSGDEVQDWEIQSVLASTPGHLGERTRAIPEVIKDIQNAQVIGLHIGSILARGDGKRVGY